LVRSIRLNVNGQQSTARMRLQPPELGWIRIDTRVEGDRVQMLVQTETHTTSALLRERVAELQVALEQHGLKIDRFEVAPAPTHEQQSPAGGQQEEYETIDDGAGQPSSGEDAEREFSDADGQSTATSDETFASAGQGQAQIGAPNGAVMETRLDVRV
jgi:flagellar hook-length control protein FliK